MGTGTQLVRRLCEEVWTKRQFDVLDELCAPDCEFFDPMQGDQATGLADYKQTMAQFDQTFAVDEVPLDRVVEAGDTTVFLWRLTTHMKGDEGPSGRRVGQTSGMGLIRVRGDKIVEHRSTWDTLRFFQALGLVPALSFAPAEERVTGSSPSAR